MSIKVKLFNLPLPHLMGDRSSVSNCGGCVFTMPRTPSYEEPRLRVDSKLRSRIKQTAREYRRLVAQQQGDAQVLLVTGNDRRKRSLFIEALIERIGHERMYQFTGVEVTAHTADIESLLATRMGIVEFTGLDLQSLLRLLLILPKCHKANTVIISLASIDLVPTLVTQHIDLDAARRKGEPLFKIGRFVLYREDKA